MNFSQGIAHQKRLDSLTSFVPGVQEALLELVKGNYRFINNKLEHPRQGADRRMETLEGQNPFAIILTCSDSRVPPEIIFDVGIGDLFVVRTAGNLLDDVALGSIEYAVEHLSTPLLLVMGHQQCGAVKAACEKAQGKQGEGESGRILVEKLQPAVEIAQQLPGDLEINAVNANIAIVANQLMVSEPILKEYIQLGKLEILSARYDLDSGVVSLL